MNQPAHPKLPRPASEDHEIPVVNLSLDWLNREVKRRGGDPMACRFKNENRYGYGRQDCALRFDTERCSKEQYDEEMRVYEREIKIYKIEKKAFDEFVEENRKLKAAQMTPIQKNEETIQRMKEGIARLKQKNAQLKLELNKD